MLSTATALARFGEIGIARGHYFAVHRAAGDAVAPYGMGLPILEAPLVRAAGLWERVLGARTSQTLFVLLQIALVVHVLPSVPFMLSAVHVSGDGSSNRRLSYSRKEPGGAQGSFDGG